MTNYVCLLRAVNVGGTGKMPMKEACAALQAAGLTSVKSYIASGNIVFVGQGDVTALVEETLSQLVGATVEALCFDEARYLAAIAGNPFTFEAGNQLHGFFCWDEPEVDWGLVEELRSDTENFAQVGRMLWLHAPDGIGRSKLAEKLAKVTGKTKMTARNMNTILKLKEMLDAM
ncbi:DUF1697 domain-containing protein [Marivivens sp. LCG002]|uniref:DUF1697 domain-containing protein n=1 Tax=Marivivens sp. LCG002 TaxID=3051171 RepID=UPI002555BB7E|nr:DUF1697 domain-containing protein [Marivivens sp. LCG002]WIV51976.1 DUF1697 domain-containing protein [Marivivens sp. LCG002]